mgnify:CR=1 FL=1
MSEILTAEQVSDALSRYPDGSLVGQLCIAYNALREQLAEAIARHSEAESSRLFVEWHQHGQPEWKEFVAVHKAEAEAERLREDLVAARADVRALADAALIWTQEALARPGVQRIMEEQDVHRG